MALPNCGKRKYFGASSGSNLVVGGDRANSRVCTIRDNDEPKSLQSSLLSFFPATTRSFSMKCKTSKSPVKPSSASRDSNHSFALKPTNSRNVFAAANCRKQLSSKSSSSTTLLFLPKKKQRMSVDLATKNKKISSVTTKQTTTLRQSYLDFGQSNFGQVLCKTCGTLYMPGIAEDEIQHRKICYSFLYGVPIVRGNVKGGRKIVENIKLPGSYDSINDGSILVWKPTIRGKKRPKLSVRNDTDTRIVEYGTKNDEKNENRNHLPSQWPLLSQIMSKDLGTHEESTLDHIGSHVVYMFVSTVQDNKNRKLPQSSKSRISNKTNRILGVVTVQVLNEAYRMMNLHERSLSSENAKLGICLLWTHPSFRHKGIATRLIDAARTHTIFGMRIPRTIVAFSSPTQAGYDFAVHYVNNHNNIDASENGSAYESYTKENCNNVMNGTEMDEKRPYTDILSQNKGKCRNEKKNVRAIQKPLVFKMSI